METPAVPSSRPITRSAWVIALASTLLRLWVAPSYGYLGVDGDLIEHKQAVHLALTRGISEVYLPSAANDPALTGRDWAGGFFINNLPLILYVRAALGGAYRTFNPESIAMWDWRLNYFDLDRTDLRDRLAASRGFTMLLKVPGIVADAGIVLALALFTRGLEPRARLAAAAAYAFNPAVVFNTAFWGQHDAVWIAFVTWSLIALSAGHLTISWAALALASVTKPQAWAFVPLVLGLSLIRFTCRDLARGLAAATLVVFFVFLPFLLHGTLGVSLDALYRSTFGGEPFVSCNAANLWWLLTGGQGFDVGDAQPLLGPMTPRALGLAACLGVCVLVVGSSARAKAGPRALFFGASVVGMGFFIFATELHENHMAAVVPLLAFAAGRDRRLWALLVVLSLTLLANLSLFDPAVTNPLAAWVGGVDLPIRPLSMGIATVNVGAFLALCASGLAEVRRSRGPGGSGGAPSSLEP